MFLRRCWIDSARFRRFYSRFIAACCSWSFLDSAAWWGQHQHPTCIFRPRLDLAFCDFCDIDIDTSRPLSSDSLLVFIACVTSCFWPSTMDFLKSAVASAIAKSSSFPYLLHDEVESDNLRPSIWSLFNATKKVCVCACHGDHNQ